MEAPVAVHTRLLQIVGPFVFLPETPAEPLGKHQLHR
jgi:hypothetical protein